MLYNVNSLKRKVKILESSRVDRKHESHFEKQCQCRDIDGGRFTTQNSFFSPHFETVSP